MAPTPVTILLVVRDPDDAQRVRELLQVCAGLAGTFETKTTLAESLDWLAGNEVDIVLSDLELPDSSGLETLRRLCAGAGRAAVVVLAAADDSDTALKALRDGAQDLLIKGQFDGVLLARALRYAMERKRAQNLQRLSAQILQRLNASASETSLVREILFLIKSAVGVEAAGVRLRDGEDFPYAETSGFPESFVQHESSLCERDASGTPHRDDNGAACLHCICGRVLRCKTVVPGAFTTAGGSFWTNHLGGFLESLDSAARQNLRGHCHAAGYASMAQIPLSSDGETIGLLQLNDRRRDRFSADLIAHLEGLGASIGVAISRTRAESALRSSQEKLRSSSVLLRNIMDSSQDMIFVKDPGLRTVLCNHAWAQAVGKRPDETCGRTDLENGWDPELVHGNAAAGINGFEADEQKALSGETVHNHCERTKIKGQIRVLDTLRQPLRDPQGNIVGILGIARDVTERSQLEEHLRQAQKIEAIGQLAGGVAHDFNNLLFVINGRADVTLERMSADDPLRHQVELIRKTGERAAKLTGQLLAFSRRQLLQPRVVDINVIVNEVGKMLLRLIPENITMRLSLDPSAWHTRADPSQLEQVLINLVVNARDAMPGGGELRIESGNVEISAADDPNIPPGNYVRLSISDSGCGMDADVKTHIFEPFFTTKGKGKGTGLGLAMVYGIIKQSLGHISVRSEPGAGTTFHIYLPQVSASVASGSNAKLCAVPNGKETVLLVEDEPEVRALAAETLEASGYTVIEATNGEEGLSVCYQRHGKIDLITTDVIMPKMGGIELSQRVNRLWPKIKLLFMSGYADRSADLRGALDGGAQILHKPFAPGALAQKVREVLDMRSKGIQRG